MGRTPLFSQLRRAFARARLEAGKSIGECHAREEAGRAGAQARREFLRHAGASAMGLSVPFVAGCGGGAPVYEAAAPALRGPVPSSRHKVAVVGGGIAGLHAAYRLAQAGVNVRVYEASARIGGRMFSARGKMPDDIVVELGGELIDSNHATMWALARELGVQMDDLFSGYPNDPRFERETYFFDGERVSDATILEEFRPLAAQMSAALARAEADPPGVRPARPHQHHGLARPDGRGPKDPPDHRGSVSG